MKTWEDLIKETEILNEEEREERRFKKRVTFRLKNLEEMANAIAEGSADDKTRLDAIKFLINKVVRDPPRSTELSGPGGGPMTVVAPMARPNLDVV